MGQQYTMVLYGDKYGIKNLWYHGIHSLRNLLVGGLEHCLFFTNG